MNKRTQAKIYDVNGQPMTIRQMAEAAGCGFETMRFRMATHTPAEAVAMGRADRNRNRFVLEHKAKHYMFRGELQPVSAIAKTLGIMACNIHRALRAKADLDVMYPPGYVRGAPKPKKPRPEKQRPQVVKRMVVPKMVEKAVNPAPKPRAPSGPVICNVQPVTCPSGTDNRYTVKELPAGYRSQLSASECRGWAAAVAR